MHIRSKAEADVANASVRGDAARIVEEWAVNANK